jgi:hypothetical protein
MRIECEQCGNIISQNGHQVRTYIHHFCSCECYHLWRKNNGVRKRKYDMRHQRYLNNKVKESKKNYDIVEMNYEIQSDKSVYSRR